VIDPVLATLADVSAADGRELGPWHMVPWFVSVPVAMVVIAALAWYFMRLGRPEVPRSRRMLRRLSIAFVASATASLVIGLTFIHPHENRVGFALAWLAVSVSVIACAVLAAVDVVVTTRQGLHEFRELKKETFGGGRRGASGESRDG